MSKIIKFVEKLPLVRLLQVTAIFILFSGLGFVGQMWFEMSKNPMGITKEFIISFIPMGIFLFCQFLFQPLVLLALAEIIKGQAQQTNLHD